MKLLAFVAALAAPGLASAQEVLDCDWQASARSIAEPWEENTRTFANGDVRLALLDTIEPAAGSTYLLVLSPPFHELGDRQCKVIGLSSVVGFTNLEFSTLQADYDPAVGLVFTIDGSTYVHETGGSEGGVLSFSLNQATGDINPSYEPDPK
ncbi:hypothetical protein OU789_12615 [Halocynthiibacter sp. C4]|uniref:hypothetical protein n=1 Tax=Halocynthiibacter sp. C4 TaxID=2992758 RepID=UPI00237AEFFE|nr:hypothetical protein [Halocynthiibacter sp. C4]MDE0590772.1 hypothetical protein [Halocynthiibacter sp. C4]